MKRVGIVLGIFAALLFAFLLGGILLPGEWSAERSLEVPHPPEAVFARLDSPREWERWTPWPEAGRAYEGPERGVGAARVWDDPDYGSGRFEITGSAPPDSLNYRVEVEGGAIRIDGVVRLEPRSGGSTRVTWREDGDFGWNPLLGYAARTMEESQGAQFEQGLARLRNLLDSLAAPSSEGEAVPGGSPGAEATPQ